MVAVGVHIQEGWQTAEFRFYEGLSEFLPAERRKRSFAYVFLGAPAVKDAIEALGVPHTEVDLVPQVPT